MYKIMDGNEACSYVAYNFTELAGIYPITPASPMAEKVDLISTTDELKVFIKNLENIKIENVISVPDNFNIWVRKLFKMRKSFKKKKIEESEEEEDE